MDERSISPDYSISDSSPTPPENMGGDNDATSIKNDSWSGTCIKDMYHNDNPWNYYCPPLVPSRHHTVLVEFPINTKNVPKPHVSSNTCHWDANHVRMPFAPENLFPNKEDNKLQPRWDIIQCALLRPIKNVYELEEAIFSYNLRRKKLFALHELFENEFEEVESNYFFDILLPQIVGLALQLPELIKTPIPLLKQGRPHAITLSQLQIACLLANAFLCTFPWKKDNHSYPGINFNRLFECKIKDCPEIGQKIKCLLHYFRRVCKNAPTGLVTFERKHLPRTLFPRWDQIETPISNIKLHVSSSGTIERDGLGMLQVDFANSYIGGGILGYGCVQEEIRFVICPELIISKLFTEEMAPNESLLMIGAECYSKYEGYAGSFQWVDNYDDETPFDGFGRKRTSIIAIDAICYYNPPYQFAPSKIIRELNKAYVGFYERISSPSNRLSPVATGNWGCGVFGGNLHLKALIQIMACAAANRNIVYYTFGDKKLQHAIINIYNFLAVNQVKIVQLWRYLCRFADAKIAKQQLYPFIKQCHMDRLNNTNNFNSDEIIKESPELEITKTSGTTKNHLDTPSPSTSKVTANNEREIEKEMAENLFNDVDYIENSQESDDTAAQQWQTPKNLKRTKSKTDDCSKLKGKSKKTPVKVKDIGSLFYSSDEDESSKCEQSVGLLCELDNLARPETILDLEKKNEVMDVSSSGSSSCSSDELMEVCVEVPKKQQSCNEQKIDNKPSETNCKRKSLITDYYTIK